MNFVRGYTFVTFCVAKPRFCACAFVAQFIFTMSQSSIIVLGTEKDEWV